MIYDLLNGGFGGGEFAPIGSSFRLVLIATIPIDRGAIVKMEDPGTRSPRSHVRHEVGVDERGDEDGLALRRRGIRRKFFSAVSVRMLDVRSNNGVLAFQRSGSRTIGALPALPSWVGGSGPRNYCVGRMGPGRALWTCEPGSAAKVRYVALSAVSRLLI